MTLAATIEVERGSLRLDLSLEVPAGEVLAVLGPNGSGKSTLLRVLAGLLPIDAGHVTIDGRVVDEPATSTFVEPEVRPTGVVFQDHLLFDNLTVLENVAFGLRARGVRRARARHTAGEWLDRVGLRERAADRPRSLSGGQAQRVALARALATDPRLLLLDEPLSALDAGTRRDMRREVRQHLSSFTGMRLLVTHDPIDVYALADRVAVLDAGRIVQHGTIADVTAHPRSRYVADLVGTNLITGSAAGHELVTASGARLRLADAVAGPVYASIRPQSIVVQRDAPGPSSVRNTWAGTVSDIDHVGDRVRVGVAGPVPLVAEITRGALEALGLAGGDTVHVSVKATDIEVYPA